MAQVIGPEGLDDLVRLLRESGRTVVGPTVRDGVIDHDQIETAAELPVGWTEEQDAGRYRLEPTGSSEVFAFSSPSTSWKRYLYPERTLLIRSTRRDGAVRVVEPEPTAIPLAFFGIRSCDLMALGILDAVFTAPGATDPTYAAQRADVFIVAVGCGHPGTTCFCASMDTGPAPRSGYDLAISELHDDRRHEFVVEAGSERGAELLAAIGSRPATRSDLDAVAAVTAAASAHMGRELRPEDPPRAAEHPEHPRWDDVATRCLACGNCTMVCPTCFCGTTEDSMDLAGLDSERWRVWDSCFNLDFTHMQGGAVRSSVASRYRQWLLHKLVTWHDQFGSSGCVGCGRCITWCPVGIDLTEEIAALAAAPEEPTTDGGRS